MWQSCWQRHLKGKNTCSGANEIPRGIKNEIQNELIASQKAIVSSSFCKARLAQKQNARIVFRNTNCVFSVGAVFVDLLLSFYRSFHVSCRLTVRAFRWSLPCGLSWWMPMQQQRRQYIDYVHLKQGRFFSVSLWLWSKYHEHRQGVHLQAGQAKRQPPIVTISVTRVYNGETWYWMSFQRIESGFKSTQTRQVKSNFRLSTHGQALMKYSRAKDWFLLLSTSNTYNI